MRRLRINLALGLRSEKKAAEPTQLWKSRCHSGRISISPSHDDFPCLLAEALDWLAAENFQIAEPAKKLGVSTSQLIKFLKLEDSAVAWVNRQRSQMEMAPLK